MGEKKEGKKVETEAAADDSEEDEEEKAEDEGGRKRKMTRTKQTADDEKRKCMAITHTHRTIRSRTNKRRTHHDQKCLRVNFISKDKEMNVLCTSDPFFLLICGGSLL